MIPVADRATTDLLDRFHGGLFDEYGKSVALALPDADQREMLSKRKTQLSNILRPASEIQQGNQRVALALTSLLSKYINAKPADVKATTAAFTLDLARYPAWAVERACLAISAGQVAGLSPDFPPSAPRIAQVAQAYLDHHYVEKAKIEKVLTAKLAYQPSEEERAKVHAGLVDLADTLRAKADFHDEGGAQRKARNDEAARQASEREIRLAREAAGLAPSEPGAIPVSPSLLKTLAE